MMPRSPRALVALALALTGCAAPPAESPAPPRGPAVHLVIDVGSTGARLYLWKVERGATGCKVGAAAPVAEPVERKIDKLGWARWARGKSPAEVRARVKQETQAMLAEAHAAEAAPVHAVAAGTGGFRDPDTAAPAEGVPELAAVWDGVRDALTDPAAPLHLAPDHVTARAIPGEDEARTAWVGLRELRSLEGDFAVLEVGGATVQFAWGPKGAAYDQISGASDYKGQDAMFAFLARAPGDATPVPKATAPLPDAAAFHDKCVLAKGKHGDGKGCADLIHDAVFLARGGWPYRLAPALGAAAPGEVFGLGALKFVLEGGAPTRTVADLEAQAAAVCALDLDAAAQKISFQPDRACYRAAYAAAFFRSVAGKARAGALSRSEGKGGGDLWVRGIAVEGRFFPDCR